MKYQRNPIFAGEPPFHVTVTTDFFTETGAALRSFSVQQPQKTCHFSTIQHEEKWKASSSSCTPIATEPHYTLSCTARALSLKLSRKSFQMFSVLENWQVCAVAAKTRINSVDKIGPCSPCHSHPAVQVPSLVCSTSVTLLNQGPKACCRKGTTAEDTAGTAKDTKI